MLRGTAPRIPPRKGSISTRPGGARDAQGMFDTLEYLAPKKTVSYPLHGVRLTAEPITLELVFAGNGTAFYNEFAKVPSPPPDETSEQRAARRERIARLFATHVVTGWSHVVDQGQPVAFTPDNCLALFRQLIRLKDSRGEMVGRWEIVDAAIVFAMDPDNFSEPIVSAADLGKG